MSIADHYTYRVFWSPEDQEYVGVCAELPGLSFLDPDSNKAFAGVRDVAREGILLLEENGDPIPQPLVARAYSGVFKVRIPAEVHRQLALDAAEQGISLNRLVNARLVGEVAEPVSVYGKRVTAGVRRKVKATRKGGP